MIDGKTEMMWWLPSGGEGCMSLKESNSTGAVCEEIRARISRLAVRLIGSTCWPADADAKASERPSSASTGHLR